MPSLVTKFLLKWFMRLIRVLWGKKWAQRVKRKKSDVTQNWGSRGRRTGLEELEPERFCLQTRQNENKQTAL